MMNSTGQAHSQQQAGEHGTSASNEPEELNMPRTASSVMKLLKDMGIQYYEPMVVPQLLEFAQRYIHTVLEDAVALADHKAPMKEVEVEDVKLAIASRIEFVNSAPPPREFLLEVSREQNSKTLADKSSANKDKRLPSSRHCLLNPNYIVDKVDAKAPPGEGNWAMSVTEEEAAALERMRNRKSILEQLRVDAENPAKKAKAGEKDAKGTMDTNDDDDDDFNFDDVTAKTAPTAVTTTTTAPAPATTTTTATTTPATTTASSTATSTSSATPFSDLTLSPIKSAPVAGLVGSTARNGGLSALPIAPLPVSTAPAVSTTAPVGTLAPLSLSTSASTSSSSTTTATTNTAAAVTSSLSNSKPSESSAALDLKGEDLFGPSTSTSISGDATAPATSTTPALTALPATSVVTTAPSSSNPSDFSLNLGADDDDFSLGLASSSTSTSKAATTTVPSFLTPLSTAPLSTTPTTSSATAGVLDKTDDADDFD